MAANNEIGVLQPLAEIGAIAQERGVLFHTDAAQAAGKIPLDVATPGHRSAVADRRTSTTGPKGAGALYVRRSKPKLALTCQIDGGGHENGLRSGTLNVPGIVGLGRGGGDLPARDAERSRRGCRRCAIGCSTGCERDLDGVRVNGLAGDRRLPHNLHVSFDDVEGEALLMALGDLAVSTGSACSSGSQAPSHVLQAIGADRRSRRRLDPLRPRPDRRPTRTSTSPSTASSTVVRALRRQLAFRLELQIYRQRK